MLIFAASQCLLVALLNFRAFDDTLLSCLLMDVGMFLIMAGGWLDLLCTYAGVFPGLLYGA